jgi:hypothetical protein
VTRVSIIALALLFASSLSACSGCTDDDQSADSGLDAGTDTDTDADTDSDGDADTDSDTGSASRLVVARFAVIGLLRVLGR